MRDIFKRVFQHRTRVNVHIHFSIIGHLLKVLSIYKLDKNHHIAKAGTKTYCLKTKYVLIKSFNNTNKDTKRHFRAFYPMHITLCFIKINSTGICHRFLVKHGYHGHICIICPKHTLWGSCASVSSETSRHCV